MPQIFIDKRLVQVFAGKSRIRSAPCNGHNSSRRKTLDLERKHKPYYEINYQQNNKYSPYIRPRRALHKEEICAVFRGVAENVYCPRAIRNKHCHKACKGIYLVTGDAVSYYSESVFAFKAYLLADRKQEVLIDHSAFKSECA